MIISQFATFLKVAQAKYDYKNELLGNHLEYSIGEINKFICLINKKPENKIDKPVVGNSYKLTLKTGLIL